MRKGGRKLPPTLMWYHERIMIHGVQPSIYQQCKGSLLIVGAGRCLWEDLESVKDTNFDKVMGVNLAASFYPGRLNHIATLEENMAGFAIGLRERLGHPHNHIHIHKNRPEGNAITWDIDHDIYSGTSGLFSVICGVLLGFQKIVIAGMPLDNSGRFFDPAKQDTGRFNYSSREVHRAWDKFMNLGDWPKKVRACSGHTKAWFGAP